MFKKNTIDGMKMKKTSVIAVFPDLTLIGKSIKMLVVLIALGLMLLCIIHSWSDRDDMRLLCLYLN